MRLQHHEIAKLDSKKKYHYWRWLAFWKFNNQGPKLAISWWIAWTFFWGSALFTLGSAASLSRKVCSRVSGPESCQLPGASIGCPPIIRVLELATLVIRWVLGAKTLIDGHLLVYLLKLGVTPLSPQLGSAAPLRNEL